MIANRIGLVTTGTAPVPSDTAITGVQHVIDTGLLADLAEFIRHDDPDRGEQPAAATNRRGRHLDHLPPGILPHPSPRIGTTSQLVRRASYRPRPARTSAANSRQRQSRSPPLRGGQPSAARQMRVLGRS